MITRNIAVVLLLVGLVSLVIGGVFVGEGVSKGNLVVNAMASEKITYGGADGEIEGIIDCIPEAQVMSGILKEHRTEMGVYTELERTDPARQTILNAMTMENSLNLAQAAAGLAQIAVVSGIFMIVVGIGFGAVGIAGFRSRQ